ncbi:MAG: molybdenum cofactor biosynthesis protein MoaE [Methanotrichaceae archaeon]|nr:molybdenum cofactor biosynthesis protein MoaE [Methanotrichaceae archaeon]MDD1758426.1 molybdenum cofactor biosynthesis protein MoaE [Methanotrichaceae archaeon]
MIEIAENDFSIDEIVNKAKQEEVGAIVIFLGIVRNDGITSMELESYREAALLELGRIRDEAVNKFGLKTADIFHRVGRLSVGDNIGLIVCSAAHRNEAFDGCRFILEELKARVPIWKKEILEDGTRWVGL